MKQTFNSLFRRNSSPNGIAVLPAQQNKGELEPTVKVVASLDRPWKLAGPTKATNPDVVITVPTGPTQFHVVHAHKPILRKHSKYFQDKLDNTENQLVTVSLPVMDTAGVFSHLMTYMTQNRRTWPPEKHIYTAYMAFRLGIPTIVHNAKQELITAPTAVLIQYLQITIQELDCKEFIKPIVSCLARRLHEAAELEALSALPFDLMEIVLKSPEVNIFEMSDFQDFVARYQQLRESTYGKRPSAKLALRLSRLVEILTELKKSVTPIRNALLQRNFKFCESPWRMIFDIQDDVYKRLQQDDVENVVIPRRYTTATSNELARIKKAQEQLDRTTNLTLGKPKQKLRRLGAPSSIELNSANANNRILTADVFNVSQTPFLTPTHSASFTLKASSHEAIAGSAGFANSLLAPNITATMLQAITLKSVSQPSSPFTNSTDDPFDALARKKDAHSLQNPSSQSLSKSMTIERTLGSVASSLEQTTTKSISMLFTPKSDNSLEKKKSLTSLEKKSSTTLDKSASNDYTPKSSMSLEPIAKSMSQSLDRKQLPSKDYLEFRSTERFTVGDEHDGADMKTPRATRRLSDSGRLNVDAALSTAHQHHHHRSHSASSAKPVGRKARIVLP